MKLLLFFRNFSFNNIDLSDNKKRQMFMTKIISIMALITIFPFTIFILIGWIIGTFNTEPVIIIFILNILIGCNLWFLKYKYWRLSSYNIVAIFFGLGLYGSIYGSILSPAIILYVIAILLSSILLNLWDSWIILILSLVFHLGLTLAKDPHSIPELLGPMIMITGGMLGITVLQHFSSKIISAAINQIKIFSNDLQKEITERKQAEVALRENEEKYRILIERSLAGIYITQNHLLRFANQRFAEIFGYESAEEILGRHVNKLVAPESWNLVDREVKLRESGKKQTADYEFKAIKKDGSIIEVEALGNRIIYRGEPAIQGMMLDITGRKRIENALKLSEERYKTLSDITFEGIAIHDSKRFIDVNKAFADMSGYSIEELLNMDDIVYTFAPESRDDFITYLNEKSIKAYEIVMLRKDGKTFPAEVQIKYIGDEEQGIVHVSSFRDILERKQAEAEHLRLQNLESLGILAGGIAHDFNNILTTIMGKTSLALIKLRDENVKSMISSILEATKRAVGLTQQLLTFAKGGTPQKSFIPIRKIILETTKFSLSGSNIEAEFVFNDSISIEADPGQFSQVIQNIVINAKQSMLNGGTINISTEDYLDYEEKLFIKIIIKDNGTGIPNENIDKIFDPYFTTKKSGSGLGLSVSHSIIKRHGGKIFVDSTVGVGTIFTILLPASVQSSENKDEKQNLITQKLKVLIMDDEESILEVLSEILENLGHQVSISIEGNEAIKMFKESIEMNKPYDIVFLDLTVKRGLGGQETVKKIREIDPNAKIIVSSGYADTSISSYKEDGFDAKLNKPYTIEEVRKIITKLINQK